MARVAALEPRLGRYIVLGRGRSCRGEWPLLTLEQHPGVGFACSIVAEVARATALAAAFGPRGGSSAVVPSAHDAEALVEEVPAAHAFKIPRADGQHCSRQRRPTLVGLCIGGASAGATSIARVAVPSKRNELQQQVHDGRQRLRRRLRHVGEAVGRALALHYHCGGRGAASQAREHSTGLGQRLWVDAVLAPFAVRRHRLWH
mmetsp:Transcript_40597/g.101981  ORF Transcript_40597/g.101981 Transcript_40597/m.101981 type:complete len:203 (-) Transcript_40597:415-1023(-)